MVYLLEKYKTHVWPGMRMSTENLKHASQSYAYRGLQHQWSPPDITQFANRTFNGYHRKDGRVGTANYWLFIPTVFCENRNLDVIKEALQNQLGYGVAGRYKNYVSQLADAFLTNTDLEEINFSPR